MNMNGIEVTLTTKSNWLRDAGYSVEDQEKIYDDLLTDVIENPRWYLDQLNYLPEFRVNWVNYVKQNNTRPYKYVNKRDK